ncbi:MAG: NAD(P)(+) transhydrogenase (Re/Si-specific) subunit beta [Gemmatimonadota bacterium]|nr:NAD(P)(+) transhydrogenase (Re/Si-specific) subunit beta [Gemmatimonadota bacterium]
MKRLGSPATARRGNQLAAMGMVIAVVATLLVGEILSPWMIVGGIALGALIGGIGARRVQMTAMPEMVALLNGLGGGASVLVAGAEVARYAGVDPAGASAPGMPPPSATLVVMVMLSVLIGAVTFSGSLVAYGKLSGRVSGSPLSFPGMRAVSALLALGVVMAAAYPLLGGGDAVSGMDALVLGVAVGAGLALLLGVLLVIPIGGADMPVVVSILNSYSGLAAASTGFVLQNYALIVSGALVGASGMILSKIMSAAMNRSLLNVLIGGFGGGSASAAVAGAAVRGVRETGAEDAAVLLAYADQVIIIPGYGLAVAQAQHAVRELADLLQKRGVRVKYAIHPVAGRMPGHMNVLLAEANVPYDQLHDMEEINDEFARSEVALVIGANDVVNPAARTDPTSPIHGMPILNADRARNVIVMKRSMAAGYAGVENELFHLPHTQMLFGDAKASLEKLITEVKGA